MGWSTPSSRIEAAKAWSDSSSKMVRGWLRLGSIAPNGKSTSVPSESAAERPSLGISDPRPLPSPLRRCTAAHLLRQLPVGERAARARIEGDDRLTERGSLGEAHGAGYHVAADLRPEVVPNLVHDLVGELRAGVVHDQDDGAHLETRIEASTDELDVAQQLPQTLERVVLALDGDQHLGRGG